MGTYPLLLAFILLPGVLSAMPKGWKTCDISAKDYSVCLRREILSAVATLVNGDKKLGVFPLDPLRINNLEIPQGSGSVSIKLNFQNLDLHGIKNLDLMNVRNDWKTLDGTAKIPKLTVLGKYKVDGKVLVLPIKGEGKCNLTFDELSMKTNIKFKQIEKGGKKYFQMEKFNLHLMPKKLHIYLENLFNGDKALGDNMNVFLNENWAEILEELRPGITSALSQAFSQISNNILSKIPTDEILKKP